MNFDLPLHLYFISRYFDTPPHGSPKTEFDGETEQETSPVHALSTMLREFEAMQLVLELARLSHSEICFSVRP